MWLWRVCEDEMKVGKMGKGGGGDGMVHIRYVISRP